RRTEAMPILLVMGAVSLSILKSGLARHILVVGDAVTAAIIAVADVVAVAATVPVSVMITVVAVPTMVSIAVMVAVPVTIAVAIDYVLIGAVVTRGIRPAIVIGTPAALVWPGVQLVFTFEAALPQTILIGDMARRVITL